MQKIISFLIILCFLIIPYSSYSQQSIPEDLNEWIDKEFQKGLDSLGIVGASIVLVHGDSIIHKAGYGVENIESNISINPDTSIFTVASISKTFTATAIMQLYEQGKIGLDTDINTYLKSFTIEYPFKSIITVRHLLTHTAGFDERNLTTSVRNVNELISLSEHLKNRMPPQIRNAGEVFDYSNYGFALLGLIVEEVSGIPFSEYVADNITKPLSMNNSGFTYDDKAQKHMVTSYLQENRSFQGYEDYFPLNYPAGGFHSTAADMGEYIKMYLNKGKIDSTEIIQTTTVDKMWNEIYKNLPESPNGWGLGFKYNDWNGKKILGHGGDILGFATDLQLLPDENLGLYIAFNSLNGKQFRSEFWGKLLKKLFPEAQSVINEAPPINLSSINI